MSRKNLKPFEKKCLQRAFLFASIFKSSRGECALCYIPIYLTSTIFFVSTSSRIRS